MKKTIRLTESDLVRLTNKVIKEQTNTNMWSNFPCVAKFKDVVSPKGEKSKRGEGIFKNTLFYSNGRAMDITEKKMYFFKCDPLGIIVGEELGGLDIDV
jgi:hypothetical protein